MDTKFTYEHRKQESCIWHRGCRNAFVGGGGPNLGNKNPRWIKLREVCNSLGINNWHQFDQYLLKGQLDPRIQQMIIEFKDLTGFDGASEHREFYKLFYRVYHPELEPQEFRGLHIE